MTPKPPDPSVEQLKVEAKRFLGIRIAIGLGVLLFTALYIFWPR